MKIEHAGLMCRDTRTLADWYCRALDMKIVFTAEGENPAVFAADSAGCVIEFFSIQPGVSYAADMERKATHLAIGVEDFDAAVSRIEAAGGTLAAETLTIFAGGKVRFFRDPEGHWLHLVWRPEKLW